MLTLAIPVWNIALRTAAIYLVIQFTHSQYVETRGEIGK